MDVYYKIIPAALFLGVIALLAGSIAIVNSEFGSTMTQCYNSSYRIKSSGLACENATVTEGAGMTAGVGEGGKNVSDQYYMVLKGQEGLKTVGRQQPTIAIIIVMVIIIMALTSVFGYIGYRNL